MVTQRAECSASERQLRRVSWARALIIHPVLACIPTIAWIVALKDSIVIIDAPIVMASRNGNRCHAGKEGAVIVESKNTMTICTIQESAG